MINTTKHQFFLGFLFLFLPALLLANGDKPSSSSFFFYDESFSVQYVPDMRWYAPITLNETGIRTYYKSLNSTPYLVLLNDLLDKRESLALNDWFYFQFVQESIAAICSDADQNQLTALSWFFLTKSGYDVRLAYTGAQLVLYGRIEEEVFESPVIQINGDQYLNLSSFLGNLRQSSGALHLVLFHPGEEGNAFSLAINHWPRLAPKIVEKEVQFSWRSETYKLQVNCNDHIRAFMQRYPIFDEHKYMEVPLSEALRSTLLPQLEKIIRGKSKAEQLEVLASFTRSAFPYVEDHHQFGASKPMIAEELFAYKGSDCEDRAALFCVLVKELLDLPLLVLAYPNHLSVAVSTQKPIGTPIQFEGLNYYICDPTGPSNTSQVGNPPAELKDLPFEILASL